MSTNPNQQQQDIDALVAHYDAINNANKANKTFGNLAPQDKVVAYQSSNPSPYTCCPGQGYVPNPPDGPIYLAVISSSALLFWSYTDDYQIGFNLEKSTDGITYNPYTTVTPYTARTYLDNAVSEGNTYWYRINAYNNDGTSSWSNTASIYFPVTPPPGPISMSVFSSSAMMSWSYTPVNELLGWEMEKSTDGLVYSNLTTSAVPGLRNYEDTDTFENNTYWYRVRAYNSAGESPYSNTASIFFPLPAPYGPISASVLSSSALVSWSYADTTQQGFKVYRSVDGTTYTTYSTVPNANSRSYTDSLVYEDNSYWYYVVAYNNSGSSDASNTCSIYFPLPAPYGPISLSLSSGSANLDWTYTDTTQDGFNVFKSIDGLTYTTYSTVAHPSSRSFIDGTVQTGSTYWYAVSAYNNSGSSDNSNTASILFPVPAPYGIISASVLSGSSIVSWSYVDHAQDGFNVAISANGSPYSVSVQVPTWSVRSYLDTNVENGNTYSYQVNAYNGSGTSSWSNTASIFFPLSPPYGPISLSLASGSTLMSWSYAHTNEDGFNFEKSTDGITYTWFTSISGFPDLTRQWIDNDVSAGNTYWYRMNAFNDAGTSSYSNTASITFAGAPTGPISLSLSSGSAILDWTYTDTNQDGFNIEWSPDGLSYAQMLQIAEPSSRSFTDNDVWQDAWFYYRMNAYNVYGTSSYSNTSSIYFEGGAPVPPPEAPLFLQVFSGSAILVWESGSGSPAVNHWAIFKSTTGPSGSFTQIGTSSADTFTYRDVDVDQNRTYDYKVAGVNAGGTGSYSNIADIAVIACEGIDFNPIVYSGCLGYSSGSTYRNIYGVSVPFTTSVSQSISVWGRSADFDAYLALIDSNGNVLKENDWDGWQPSGDYASFGGNAAFSYVCPSGSYTIELSSVDNAIGRYMIWISPGPTLEVTWSNSYETATCEWIPTSNCIVVGEQGNNIMWYHVNSNSHSLITWPNGVQGIAYSPAQDRVFAWVYEGGWGPGWTASIAEYDNTGSYVGKTEYYRPLTVDSAGSTLSQTGTTIFLHTGGAINDFTTQAESGSRIWFNNQSTQGYITSITDALTASVNISQEISYDPDFFDFGTEFQITRPQVTPNPDFSGYLTYDPKHDRIAFYRYFYATNHIFNIWDCATRTFTASLNAAPYTTFSDMWEGCYSWADDCFYIATTDLKHLVKVNATTFAITASKNTIQSDVISSYASSSGLLILRNGGTGAKVVFADPVSESVVHTSVDCVNAGALFEGCGKSGDPADDCVGAYTITYDTRNGPNLCALALLDRNTYLASNYLMINSDNPGGFAPDGWYQYSIAFNESNSRVYSAQVSYDNYEGRIYSIRCTRAFGQYVSPFTASAGDTASCLTFKTDFPISESTATRVMGGYVTATRFTSSVNTLVVSDNELNDLFSGQHNFNNCFLSSSGEFLRNYTESYVHTYSGKNAVFCKGKFYMLSDGLTEQSALWEPVDGTSMLVFDSTGNLLATIPLTYSARDWDTDGDNVYVYEYNGSQCYIETIDTTSDIISSTDELQIGYTFSPGFAFFYATASATASQNYAIGDKNYPYFGRMIVFLDSNGTTQIYYNNIYGERVGTNPAPYDFKDTGSGDRIWAAGSTGYALYNYATKLDMSTGSYKTWYGSAAYCPVTDHIYWGALDINDNDVLIETTKNLAIVRSHSMTYNTPNCLVWNKKDRTIEVYQTSGFYGYMSVFDPVANTLVCRLRTLTSGSYGSGHMGWNIDTDIRTGDVYVPQRYDGAGLTGSVQIYQM